VCFEGLNVVDSDGIVMFVVGGIIGYGMDKQRGACVCMGKPVAVKQQLLNVLYGGYMCIAQ
jgi:hypothetical protein